ncbi:MAG: flippase-like domain-containing protein [Dysgonamonadaceae bacterium]|jgi:uncharacterized protein (TIRG00374 family)|nr:flippase-like domain-containing protein [Dysgonamonadaceae bacterium]
MKSIRICRVWLPVALGMFAVAWFFFKEFDVAVLTSFHFSPEKILFLFLMLAALVIMRDGSLIWRFRILSGNTISWRKAFNVHILSEFISAITPSAIGGSSLVIYFLVKEGVNAGRSTTIMLINLFLDELFFILICPLLFLFIPLDELFPSHNQLIPAMIYVFAGLYCLLLLWTSLLFTGIFIRPDWIKKIVLWIFRFPLLKRGREKAEKMTEDMLHASQTIKNYSFTFRLKLFLITAVIWFSRFFIVNIIFSAFTHVENHLTVFARQVVLWILMIVMPTPGGSGLSEYTFKEYYSDIFLSGSLVLLVVILWRFISFYMYLFFGMLILPKWMQRDNGAKV